MKTTIAIFLLTSTSLLSSNYAATLDIDLLPLARTGVGSTTQVTSSTLDELEAFFKKIVIGSFQKQDLIHSARHLSQNFQSWRE